MKHDSVFLKHIVDEINFLLEAAENNTRDKLAKDEVLSRACERSLEVIGEAIKNLSEGLCQQHPEIEWKKLAGLRDKIIHYYFGVDWDIVWDVITQKLPTLKKQIETITKTNKD